MSNIRRESLRAGHKFVHTTTRFQYIQVVVNRYASVILFSTLKIMIYFERNFWHFYQRHENLRYDAKFESHNQNKITIGECKHFGVQAKKKSVSKCV